MNNKLKNIERYYPTCPEHLKSDFNISWIDKTIIELEQIARDRTNRLTNKQRDLLKLYITDNYKDCEDFYMKLNNDPLVKLAVVKDQKIESTTSNYARLFLIMIEILRRAETKKRFDLINLYKDKISHAQ